MWIELKARVANCRVSFARNNLPAHVLPLTHEVALLRGHLHKEVLVEALGPLVENVLFLPAQKDGRHRLADEVAGLRRCVKTDIH